MKIYDITMTINEDMMVYKNYKEKKPKLNLVKNFKEDGFNESKIYMDIHTGTHIDAPFHMIDKGETIEKIDLNKLITDCYVFDITHLTNSISKSDLQKLDIKKEMFVIFKTINSYDTQFNFDYVYLDKSGSEYLSKLEISGVGIDALGIERAQDNHETHNVLMKKNIIIIEGLMLKDIDEGEYKMIALPLKIEGADGAPARIVLIEK